MSAKKQPAHEEITTVSARQNLSELVNRVAYGKSRVVLTRRNRAIAAIVPIEDVALLEEIEVREDLKAARKALREIDRKGSIPWSKIKEDLALD
jgi:prevent-host-death family protein